MSTATPKRVQFKKEVTIKSETDQNQPLKIPTSNSTETLSKKPDKSKENLITVGIRIRPLNEKEKSLGHENILRVLSDDSDTHARLILRDRLNTHHEFTSDYCFHAQSSNQTRVYECIAFPLLRHSYDGYNVSIFAYGQTGSGKTHSMIGTQKDPGLIPRFIDNLYELKDQCYESSQISTQVEISYYEIYNEKIYDLLRSSTGQPKVSSGQPNVQKKHLQIREDPQRGPFIVDLQTVSAGSAKDAKLWFDIGNKRRATSCTNMNDKSSRSHSVFQINLNQIITKKEGEKTLSKIISSKINMIDLAGSERLDSAHSFASGANLKANKSFKESTCINKSLLTLGKIICILSEKNSAGSMGYLPYRESSLTWLLKESIGGNAKTSMLATVNCSSEYIDETLSTLRYAAKTACIKNVAKLNFNLNKRIVDEFGKEIDVNIGAGGGYNDNLKADLKLMEELKAIQNEWTMKLDEANKRKEEEIKALEKSLILLYENEKGSQNCCLINLNEDPLLSEKLYYLIKRDKVDTLVGSCRDGVDIFLSGPLIAPVHAKIKRNCNNDELVIEQVDDRSVTYVNGEVLKASKPLNHGDRIIFGGSHYFRLNNPTKSKGCGDAAGGDKQQLPNEFKDFLFAKNELEHKQNELQRKYESELSKCRQDNNLKIKELESKYEQNLKKIENDLQNERMSKQHEIEQLRCESAKKMHKILQKNMRLETKINLMEAFSVSTSSVNLLGNHDAMMSASTSSLVSDSFTFQTPMKKDHIFEELKQKLSKTCEPNLHKSKKEASNHSMKFNIMLKLNEANKICSLLSFNIELALKEYLDKASDEFVQVILVLNRDTNEATLWNLNTFDSHLSHLRDLYNRFAEDNEKFTIENFLSEPEDWRPAENLAQSEDFFKFMNNECVLKTKAFKRRLSLAHDANQQAAMATPIIDRLHTSAHKKLCYDSEKDTCDSAGVCKASANTFDLAFLMKMFSECVQRNSEIVERDEDECRFLSESLVKLLMQLMNELKRVDGDEVLIDAFYQITLVFSNVKGYFEKYIDSGNNLAALIQYLNENLKRISLMINQIFENRVDNERSEVYFEDFEDAFGNLIEINGRLIVLNANTFSMDSNNVLFRNYEKFHFNLLVRFMNGIDMQFNENLRDFSNFLYEYEQNIIAKNTRTSNSKSVQEVFVENTTKFYKELEKLQVPQFDVDEESLQEIENSVLTKRVDYIGFLLKINEQVNESQKQIRQIIAKKNYESTAYLIEKLLCNLNFILTETTKFQLYLNCDIKIDDIIIFYKHIKGSVKRLTSSAANSASSSIAESHNLNSTEGSTA